MTRQQNGQAVQAAACGAAARTRLDAADPSTSEAPCDHDSQPMAALLPRMDATADWVDAFDALPWDAAGLPA